MSETQSEWIGIPRNLPLTPLQKTHDAVGLIIHAGSIILALWYFAMFWHCPELRRGPTRWHNWIILFMTMSDMILNFFQAGAVVDMLIHQRIRMSDTWCQFQGFASFMGGIASCNIMGLLTQERAHTILLGKEWTGKLTLLGGIWVFVSSVGLTMLYAVWGKFAVQESGIYCCPDYGAFLRPQEHPSVLRGLSVFLCFVGILTITSVVITYTLIWYSVYRSLRRITEVRRLELDVEESVNSRKSRTAGGASTGRKSTVKKGEKVTMGSSMELPTKKGSAGNTAKLEREIAQKCAAMVLSFVSLWLPNIAKITYNVARQKPVSYDWEMYSSLVTCAPGIVNPLVNYFMDARWRKANADLCEDVREWCRGLRGRGGKGGGFRPDDIE